MGNTLGRLWRRAEYDFTAENVQVVADFLEQYADWPARWVLDLLIQRAISPVMYIEKADDAPQWRIQSMIRKYRVRAMLEYCTGIHGNAGVFLLSNFDIQSLSGLPRLEFPGFVVCNFRRDEANMRTLYEIAPIGSHNHVDDWEVRGADGNFERAIMSNASRQISENAEHYFTWILDNMTVPWLTEGSGYDFASGSFGR